MLWQQLLHSISNCVWSEYPFPPDLQNIITPKPLELESWNIGQSAKASQWKACYQRGLPRLVYIVQVLHEFRRQVWYCRKEK